MEEEFDVVEDIENTSEDTTPFVEEIVEAEESVEDEIDYKAKYEAEAEARKKAEEVAKNQKIRAEKAERKPKPEKEQTEITSLDTIALINAKVTVKEDIDEVLDYAKHKGISVSEALNTNVVKTILAQQAEFRAVAEATNTGTARRGTAQVSNETVLANAAQGKLPDDPSSLAEARMAQMKNK